MALPKSFLHPCLLKKLGIDDDPASVYRGLRALEQQRAVSSHWHTSSNGPARHIYLLTPVGERQLHTAFEAAVDMYATIQRYFCRYAAAVPQPPVEGSPGEVPVRSSSDLLGDGPGFDGPAAEVGVVELAVGGSPD